MDGEDGGCEDQDVVMSVFLTGLPTLYQDYHQGSLFPPNPLLSMYCKKYNIGLNKKKNKQSLSSYFHFFSPLMYFHLIWNVSTCLRPIAPLVVNGKRQRAEIFPLTPQFQFPMLWTKIWASSLGWTTNYHTRHKNQNLPQKKRQRLPNSPTTSLKSNFLWVGKRFATSHLIFEHIF